MQASSAISFRLPPVSISAAASTGSPLPSTFVSGFSGLSIPHLSVLPFHFLTPAVFAFFRPLQFWVLTTQPLFLPFPLLPGFASHCVFPVLSSSFDFLSFPFILADFSSIHPVIGTWHAVCFLLLFPVSLPQPFHRCSLLLSLPCFPLLFAFFRPLSIRFQLLSFPLLPFLFFPALPYGWLFRCRRPLSVLPFLPFPLPDFSFSFSGSQYLAFCLFPFVLPCFAPTAVPQVITFCFRFRCFPLLPLSFVRFRFRSSTTQLLFLPFLLFPLPPHSGLHDASVPLSISRFPHSFHPVSRVSFLVLSTWLSAGSLSPSRFCSRSRFPGAYLLLSLSVLAPSFPLSFVHFFSGSHYSGFALSFPFFPVFHRIWSFRCLFIRFLVKPVSMLPFSFGTQPSCNFFSPFSSVSRHRRYTASDFSRLSPPAVPLSYYLRFWLLCLGDAP